jgi:hypothetical protein
VAEQVLKILALELQLVARVHLPVAEPLMVLEIQVEVERAALLQARPVQLPQEAMEQRELLQL